MHNQKEKVPFKPLNCLYCSNAVITLGVDVQSHFKSISPQPHCFCYDVPAEMFDLYLVRCPEQDIAIYNWLPYHCGHFQSSMIQLRCVVCGKPEQFEEWNCIPDIFIQGFNVLTCDDKCADRLDKQVRT